jgi:hypothetical protein
VRPHQVTIACADANLYATGLRWSRWSASGATAAGTGHMNDCTPYCAAGHFHAFRMTIRLSQPIVCKGRRRFSRITWSGARSHGTFTLGCRT